MLIHSSGTLAPPGGHLEHGESLEDCAARETLEETDLVVSGMRFLTATNDIFADKDKHYVTLYVACELESPDAEPKVSRKSSYAGGCTRSTVSTNTGALTEKRRSWSQRSARAGSGWNGTRSLPGLMQ